MTTLSIVTNGLLSPPTGSGDITYTIGTAGYISNSLTRLSSESMVTSLEVGMSLVVNSVSNEAIKNKIESKVYQKGESK